VPHFGFGASAMKLGEALDIANRVPEEGVAPKAISLVCGFTPLHLLTYLRAYGRLRFPESGISADVGLFGDLQGNLQRAAETSVGEIALVLEWSDLDPRLGIREGASWNNQTQLDILSEIEHGFNRLWQTLHVANRKSLIVVVPPTLPLPPLSHTPGLQASRFELRLTSLLSSFLQKISEEPGIRVLHSARLDELSAPGTRLDIKMALASGFPYTLSHADLLARLIIDLAYPVAPKKGLITDLDDTVWKGILGEVGVHGVKWDLAGHSRPHGVYQKMLAALADNGVLIGVASKNELELVTEAFQRADILLSAPAVFPIEASWGTKSSSIGRILQAWNIGPEAVVFVDDSLMELAEVQSLYPEMTCLRFPVNDAAGIWQLLHTLRDLFGKPRLGQEDRYRAASLKTANILRTSSESTSPDFVTRLEGTVIFDYSKALSDTRALELINKTNQFNLNGRRLTAGEWAAHLQRPDSFLATVSYEDKFGPLGKIAVVTGIHNNSTLEITSWVMSCRAFSRYIEHHTLDRLFEQFEVDELQFAFSATERNGPLQEFLTGISGALAAAPVRVTRHGFSEKGRVLPHTVIENGSNRAQITDLLHESLS